MTGEPAQGAGTCTIPESNPHDSGAEPARKRQATCTLPDNYIRNHPDTRIQPGAEPAAPAVETVPEQQQQSQRKPTTITARTGVPRPTDVRAAVEAWRIENKLLGVLDPANQMHVAAVAVLLERCGRNIPADLHEGHAGRQAARSRELRKATMRDARRIAAWAGTADKLAIWILRAVAEHGPDSVCAYLRKASSAGDPGTLLHSAKKNTVGRAAETWSDYIPATERALDGQHAGKVELLVAGGAAMCDAEVTDAERVLLRAQLADLLRRGRRQGARAVLLQLIGPDHSDVAVARAVAGVLTLEQAKELLAA